MVFFGMTKKIVRRYKSGKANVVLAHMDSKDLTYFNIGVPQIVPLYAEFDVSRPVGRAHLRPKEEGMIYAIVDLDPIFRSQHGRDPAIILAVSGARQVTVDGVRYLQNGVVTAASIVDEGTWNEIYSEKEAEDAVV